MGKQRYPVYIADPNNIVTEQDIRKWSLIAVYDPDDFEDSPSLVVKDTADKRALNKLYEHFMRIFYICSRYNIQPKTQKGAISKDMQKVLSGVYHERWEALSLRFFTNKPQAKSPMENRFLRFNVIPEIMEALPIIQYQSTPFDFHFVFFNTFTFKEGMYKIDNYYEDMNKIKKLNQSIFNDNNENRWF
jgi:hypothetical protein